MSTDAKVTVGVEGVDEVAAGARRATEPWQRAGDAVASSFKRAGSAIAGQLEQVGMDMLRTVTVMRTLDMRGAVDSARGYREEIARFGVAADLSFATARLGVDKISRATLESESSIVGWARGVGRLTYDYTGAALSAKSLHDESVATGKSFHEMGHLGVVLHNALGVTDDMGTALGTIRSQAEMLGTVGGVAAFQDQIEALAGTFQGLASDSTEARNRITALVGTLGRGYRPEQAKQIQQGVLGALQGRSYDISRSLGYDILNEKGEVADPTRVVRDLKHLIERTGRSTEERRLMARGIFGDLAGSAVLRGDFSEQNIASLAATPPSTGAARAADRYAGSDAGRAKGVQLQADRKMRETAEMYLHMQDKFGEAFMDHPIAGQMVGGLLQATMRAATQQVGGLFGGGGAAGGGGAGGAAAAGGAEEGAVALGAGLGTATMALSLFALTVAATGKVLMDLGEASAKKMGLGRPEQLTPEEAKVLADEAKAAEQEAPGERSAGMQVAYGAERDRLRRGRALELLSSYEDAYRGQRAPRVRQSLIAESTGSNADPVLKAVREQLESGKLETKTLPKDIAEALVDALSRSPLKAVLQTDQGGAPTAKPGEEAQQ